MDAQPRQALPVDHHCVQPPTAAADWRPSNIHWHRTPPHRCHRMRATAGLPRCVHPWNGTRLDRRRASAQAAGAIHPCECMHAGRAMRVVRSTPHDHPARNRASASRARSSRHAALSTRHVAPRATSTHAPRRARWASQRTRRARKDPAVRLRQHSEVKAAMPMTTAPEVQRADGSRRGFHP